MRIICLILMLLVFVSCSTNPYKEQSLKQQAIMEHMAQGKQYIGGKFDSKFSSSGSDGMNLRSIGVATYPVDMNEQLAKSAAVADAKFKLTDGAPTEMKRLIQKAIGNSLGYVGEFNQIETSVTEVHALRGIEVKEDDIQCLIVSEPVSDGTYRTSRECKAIAKVSLSELTKAFNFTVERKYGIKEESVVQKILNEQLNNSVVPSTGISSVVKTKE